ncbi:Hypothetical predicted protein [Marmota monax]|uniref:Uncharacterized protein n=1 Tax=Marmota monax TaxID=9995 RepID=A0A5E4CCA2_MARMO|nr:hypothetical protein GHT09_018514 [Marmota monax]VTJ79336.1 Hypothetical predicted protein [Marmota monax]
MPRRSPGFGVSAGLQPLIQAGPRGAQAGPPALVPVQDFWPPICTGTLAATPMWTLTYQPGAPPVASILGHCNTAIVPSRDTTLGPETAASHNTACHRAVSLNVPLMCQHPAPPNLTPITKAATFILGHFRRHF